MITWDLGDDLVESTKNKISLRRVELITALLVRPSPNIASCWGPVWDQHGSGLHFNYSDSKMASAEGWGRV